MDNIKCINAIGGFACGTNSLQNPDYSSIFSNAPSGHRVESYIYQSTQVPATDYARLSDLLRNPDFSKVL